jgi:tetratricopeptide (TPR) repeat protein
MRAEAFQARSESVESLLVVASVERARGVTAELLALAQEDAERLDALIAHANVQLMAVEYDQAIETAREAIDLARTLDAPWRAYDAALLLAIGLAQAQRATEGVAVLEPFRQLVESDGDPPRRYKFWSNLAYVLQVANRRQQCVHALTQAIALAEELGDLAEVQTCTSNLAGAMANLGRVEEGLRLAERAYQLRERLGDLNSVPSAAVDSQLGQLLMAAGKYGRALAHLDAAARCFREAGHALWLAVVENHLADTLLALGQHTRAHQALSPVNTGVLVGTRVRRLLIEARLERAEGRSPRAKLQQAIDLLGDGDPQMFVLTRLEASRDLAPREAAELCAALHARAAEIEHLGIATKARLLRCEFLLRDGDLQSALTEVRSVAARSGDAGPWDMYRPEAWWIEFQVLDAAGETAAALDALRAAVAWIHGNALPDMPAEFRDSFLSRNPVNRAVLAAASRRLH